MPILFNPNKKKGFFRIPVGGTQGVSCAFSYSAASYTDADPDPTPTITGTSGGRFTSTAGVVINTITGEIDLSASTLNTYVITYTVRGKACTQSVEITGSFANTKSLVLDGVDDYLDLGTSSTLTNVSISFWVKRTTDASNESLFNGTGVFQWLQFTSNQNYLSYYDGSWHVFSGNVSDSAWHNIVIINDISATEVRSYVDGVLDTTVSSYDATSILYQFGNYNGASHFLSGTYDELAIWNSVLSSENITAIASGPSDLTSLNPVAWYRMGDNSSFKSPQILLPEDTNKDKVSNYSMAYDGVDDLCKCWFG